MNNEFGGALANIEYRGEVYDARHGGAFDRGSADSYYGRPFRPHKFLGGTYNSPEVIIEPEDPEYLAYEAGYEYNEEFGSKKDWG
jgi:hypothetical protein